MIVHPGDTVTWVCTMRGGYGYTVPVAARVVKLGPKFVQIEVALRSGETVTRWVKPESLREIKA